VPFLTVKREHYSLGNNESGDTHDTPVSEQLILCKEGHPDINKTALFKRIFTAHVQPLNVLQPWSFFTQDSFSLKGTRLPRFPWYFLLFDFCYAF